MGGKNVAIIKETEPTRPIKVLLVDDEDRFRQTIAKRLAKRGITSDQAADANECLSILKKKPMDVVVLDVKMPGMSGIDALRHIKGVYGEIKSFCTTLLLANAQLFYLLSSKILSDLVS